MRAYFFERTIAFAVPILTAAQTIMSSVPGYQGAAVIVVSLLFCMAILTRPSANPGPSGLTYLLLALGAYTLISRVLYLGYQSEQGEAMMAAVLAIPALVWLAWVRLSPAGLGAVMTWLIYGSAVAALVGSVLTFIVIGQSVNPRGWAQASMEISANRNDFSLIYLIALAALLFMPTKIFPMLRVALIWLLVLGVLLAFSRSSYAALAVLMLASAIVRRERRLVPIALLFAAGAAALIEGNPIQDRIAYTFSGRGGFSLDDSSRLRMLIWQSALRTFAANPVFGAGSGASPMPEVALITYAHNYYLTQLAQLGLVGFLLTLGMMVRFFREAARQVRPVAIFLILSLVILNVASITGDPLYGWSLNIFYLLAGAAAWRAVPSRRKTATLSSPPPDRSRASVPARISDQLA